MSMAVRMALLRSVRRSVLVHVSSCKLHVRPLPTTSPKKLMTEFKKAAFDDGVRGSQQLFQLMRVCCNGLYGETPATKVELAEEMFSVVNKRGLDVGVELHNLLLQVYKHNRHPFSQTEFLEKMKERGVAPNVGTLLLLLESYCQQGNMDGAMQVLEELKALDIAISEKTYAALISGYCETGNLAAACGLQDVMRANGLDPGFMTYTALVAGHALQGEIERMTELLEDMKAQKIYPGMHVYMSIIDSLSRGGHVKQISEILELIKDRPLVNNEIVHKSQTLAGRGEFESSLLLLRFLSQLPVETETGKVKRAGEILFKHMARSDLPLESLWPVLDELKSMHIPAQFFYDTLVYDFCYQKHRPGFVPEIVRRMHADGLQVQRHYLYPMFIQGKGDLKLIRQGIELLEELQTGIDSQTLHFIKIGAEDSFPSMFTVMKDVGLMTTANAFSALRAMLTSHYLRPYLLSFLSELSGSVSAGMVCSVILSGVREHQLSNQTLLEIFAALGSWGNKVSRKLLLDKIAVIMLEEKKIQLLLALVKNLMAEDPRVVPLSTARLLLRSLAKEGLKEEHDSLMKLLKEKDIDMSVVSLDARMLKDAIAVENIPGILAAFEQLKEEQPKTNRASVTLKAVKLLCSNPDYFARLPDLLALLNHATIPIGMLCQPILDAVRRPSVHIRMQDMVEVLRTLQPLRPAKCLTELVDRIAFSLATQMKADEILTLMKPIVEEKIVQVAPGAIFSVFNVLLNSGKRTEALDFVALLKEQKIPFQKEYLQIATKLALQEEQFQILLDAFSVVQEEGKVFCDLYPILKPVIIEKYFHYLPEILSKVGKNAIAPGLLCSLIFGAVTAGNIGPKDVIGLLRSLESWEPELSRQELAHRIIGIYIDQEKFEEAIAMARLLLEENVVDLAYKTVYRLIKGVAHTELKEENAELIQKLEMSKKDTIDYGMLEMIDGDVEAALKNWDKVKMCESASQLKCTVRMCRRLCSEPKLFIHLPQFLTLVDQSFLPPSLLGSQLSRGITNTTPPLNLESIFQVLTTLRDWEPRFSREELLSSVAITLSRQERVIELLTLVKNTMMKDIMPVSMHVIDQVLANLLRKRMKTEQLNLFELMKEKGMDFDQDWMLLNAATRAGDIDSAETAFKALQEAGRADTTACSMMLHLLCKKKWDGSAQRFYSEMVAVGLHPDELASCELINRVLKNDNMDFANEIQSNMQERGLSLNMLAFNALIFAYARHGDVDAVKKVLQEVMEANLLPSAVSVKGLMMAYHTSGDQDGMLQVQDYLEKTSCTPHQFDTNMLRVLQNSNAKPYLFSGSAGPGTP